MKSIYGVIGILSLVFAGCGGSGDDDSSGSSGGKGGSSGGTAGQAAGSTNPDVQKLIDACVTICDKENSCANLSIDCTGECNTSFQNVSQVPASTTSCDVDAFEAKAQDCANGDCSALSDCESQLDTICHH